MINTCDCGIEIDEEDRVCCLCVDDAYGRNQHFWAIKMKEVMFLDYCDLCEKKKQVKRSECYALKVCKSCNENFPGDDYCKDMQQDR